MSKRIPIGDSGPCELLLAEGWRGGPWEVGLLVLLLCRLQIRGPRRIKDVGSRNLAGKWSQPGSGYTWGQQG